MSLGVTAAGAQHVLDLIRSADTAPSSYHVALVCTVPPGFTIGGEELDEPRFDGYARGELVNDSASWQLTGLTMSNLVEVTFPVADADWGQIGYLAVCDQPLEIGGRVLYCGEVDTPLFVSTGDQVFLGPGEVVIDVSGVQWLSEGMP